MCHEKSYAEKFCGDYPAPCNCDNAVTHDHSFERLNYPGGKDGLCAVMMGGELCLHSQSEH